MKDLMASWDEYATKQTWLEEGRTEIRNEVIKNLITSSGFSDAKAADIANVPVAFVKKVRRKQKKISEG